MADILWPATLPQAPATFSQAPTGNTAIRTQPDDGPAKSRRRFTKAVIHGSMGWLLSIEQWRIFDNFYKVTCNEGTSFFVMNHPWYGEPRKFRILPTPKSSANGTMAVDVSCEWGLF